MNTFKLEPPLFNSVLKVNKHYCHKKIKSRLLWRR